MAQQARTFQDPAYVTRQAAFLGETAAGSGGLTSKFAAHAALLLMALTTYQTVLGTSTYTNTVTGTATGTGTISGQQLNLIVIQNTSTTTTVALSTTTVGPFLAGGQGTVGQLGGGSQFTLNTQPGIAGQGGIPIPQGAIFYVVSGTDATAKNACTIDYQIQPGAGVTI
jgi:hypothetical protein